MATFERISDQQYHDLDGSGFRPMGLRMLVELDVGEVDTSIVLTTGNFHNMQTARVRMLSPQLPEVFFERLLPEGNGSFGERLLIPEAQTHCVEDPVYKELGLEVPSADASDKIGELALVAISDAIAVVDDDPSGPVPFTPLGHRVFFEFDYDDQGVGVVGVESGKKYERQTADSVGELVIPESAKAQTNNLATVTATGPEATYIKVGDRLLPPARYQSVLYNDVTYYFVEREREVMGIVENETETAEA